MNSSDLNLLTALDMLLATGSVSVAAHRMHLSAPAMSHTLARIRDALGDPILVRAGRKLVPTARALELREPVRVLVAQAHELMQPSGARGAQIAQLQRDFVVRAPDGIAIVHGARLLAALQQMLPLATLRFVPEVDGDTMALREGRIDLDIGAVNERGPEILSEPLYTQDLVGAVKAGHALTDGRITIKRLAEQAHVAISQRGRVGEAIDVMLAAVGHRRRITLSVPSAYGALMAAAQSAMVAIAPAPLARGVAPGLGLQLFKLPLAVPAELVVQAWHPRVQADAAHQVLRRCVAELSKRAGDAPLPERPGQRSRHQVLLALGQSGGEGRRPAKG
jgi:DNA-binding transcriptional LysR family regulator